MKIKKTNAMRVLEQNKINYTMHSYNKDEIEKGIPVWTQIDKPDYLVYKTIVLHHENDTFVAVIPINKHIDLKKAARAFNVKRLDLLPLNDLLKTTGYVRGGCSPIGMKKQFPTLIDHSALSLETIIVSAGRIGSQMEMNAAAMADVINAKFVDLIMK